MLYWEGSNPHIHKSLLLLKAAQEDRGEQADHGKWINTNSNNEVLACIYWHLKSIPLNVIKWMFVIWTQPLWEILYYKKIILFSVLVSIFKTQLKCPNVFYTSHQILMLTKGISLYKALQDDRVQLLPQPCQGHC